MSEAADTEALGETPAYVLLDGSFLIDRPVDVVWPLILEYTSWQQYSSADHISGKAGHVGEVVLLKKEEPGLENFPQYYARTLKIEPCRRVVWKTWPAVADQGPPFWGIVDFRVSDKDGRTRFTYSVYYEFALQGEGQDAVSNFEAEMTNGFEELMSSVFPKLRNLAEHGYMAESATT